ncbi:MAG: BlaI/MecI/CopY family transcriptional regulator [Ignavibacteriaceae bacterium]
MARKKNVGPTNKELQILSVLWKYGPSTVREVNSKINQSESTGYTTTLKLMQIMFEKGLLKRDESSKTHVYTPANSENLVKKEIVGSLVNRVFAGSAAKLVISALSSEKVSKDELEKIKTLIRQKENEL